MVEYSAWLLLQLGLEHRQHKLPELNSIGQHLYANEGELGVSSIQRGTACVKVRGI